jgi:mono/diheme cytochrome c family protein
MLRALRNLLVLLATFVLAAALYIASGRYDVAASSSPSAAEEWLLGQVRERSIAKRAAGITPPPLGARAELLTGFELYRAHCVTCHSGPGLSPEELAMGLHPVPPGLGLEKVQARSDAELFWIVKNGIRFTGMPSFGLLRSDEELWALVAFVRELPKLDPEAYKRLAEEVAAAADAP